MAFTFVQEPIGSTTTSPVLTNWTPVVPYTVYRSNSVASYFYYKLVLEVRLDTSGGELLAKLKQRRNGYTTDIAVNYARATFDIRDIVNTQLEHTLQDMNDKTTSIHTLGKNAPAKPYSKNYHQVKKIYVKAYENYSTAENTSPTDQTGSAINDTKFYIAASLDLNTPRGTDDFQDTAFSAYSLDGDGDLFLSDVQEQGFNLAVGGTSARVNYVQSDDYHTVGFLNGEDDFDSIPSRMYITYYDSSGSIIGSTQYITNSDASGGAVPQTSGTEVNLTSEMLLYFGAGPGNLQAQSAKTAVRPSNFTDWHFYTVQAYNADGSAARSAKYYFVNQDGSCRGFKVRRLAWINSKGCWDYFNFRSKSIQKLEVKRNNYERMLGSFSEDMYAYDNFRGGKTTRATTAVLKETIQTDFISEADAVLLENLIMSTSVQIVQNSDTDYTVPVMITSSSFIRKTVANDRLIKYTIEIEYANPVNTNS